MAPIDLIFLGTGTSAGVPMIGCHCDVCSSADPRDDRTRCSVVIGYDGISVLIDTTPELRLQCVRNRVDRIDAVVITHAHADHIMGMDDLRRFNTLSGGPLDCWIPIPLEHGNARCLGFRVDDFAYCTDASGIGASSRARLKGLDLLVLDALQDTKHPTHLTIAEALEIVAELRPRRTLLTHMSHRVLHARDEARLPHDVRFAFDGMRVRVE
jgi:phosphoribosyl 1,2-cyclic phosphate phosphodiesterase